MAPGAGRGVLTDDDRALVASAVPVDEESAFLLTSLADLEAERAAGDIDEADYATLRDDYTARAAAALRGVVPVPASSERRGRARPVLVGLGVVVLAGGAGWAAARTAGDRLPGAEATGTITATGSGEKLSRAAALAGQGDLLAAIKLYDEVIAADAQNVQALAYRGWLVRLVGRQANDATLIDKGLDFINRAVAVQPGYPDARFFKGEILLRDKNDPAGAIPEFEAYLANGGAPEMTALVQGELNAARQAAAAPESAPPGACLEDMA